MNKAKTIIWVLASIFGAGMFSLALAQHNHDHDVSPDARVAVDFPPMMQQQFWPT